MNELQRVTKKINDEAGNTVAILARLQLSYEKRMVQLRMDMLKSEPGSKTRLDFIRAMGKEERDHTELLMSLGYLPKNLGMQTVEKYTFTSSIGLGGNTKAVQVLEGELVDDPKQLKE